MGATAETRFVSVGDWGIGSNLNVYKSEERENMERTASAMSSHADEFGPEFVLALGDNFYKDGVASIDDALWEDVWRTKWLESGSLRLPWYAILGNHDYHKGVEAASSQVRRTAATDDDEWHMPAALTYTVTRDFVTIVCIDTAQIAPHETDATEEPYGDAEAVRDALEVIDAELARAAALQPKWLLVAGHYPIRSHGEHGDTQQLVELLLPILRRRKVDAYLCGHDHILQALTDDTSPLTFIVSGNGAKVSGYMQEFHDIDPGAHSLFASLQNGFTSHLATDDALVTSFVDSRGGTPVYTVTQDPWRPKCGEFDILDCPLPSSSSSSSSSSSGDGWRLGTNAAVVFALAGLVILAVGLLFGRCSSSSARHNNKLTSQPAAEMTTMLDDQNLESSSHGGGGGGAPCPSISSSIEESSSATAGGPGRSGISHDVSMV